MTLKIEIEQEEDGRWIAEVVELPGVIVYGKTPDEAKSKAQALALRTLADRLENGETETEQLDSISTSREPVVQHPGEEGFDGAIKARLEREKTDGLPPCPF